MRVPIDLNNALNAAQSVSRSTAVSTAQLRLTTPLDALLQIGNSATAEVVSLKQSGSEFQVQLRLQLPDGRQATVTGNTTQPLVPGSEMTVTRQTAASALTIQTAQAANTALLTQIDSKAVPTGTLLQGKVISSQLQQGADGQTTFKNLLTLVNTALAGRTLVIESAQPLRPGSLLTAQVTGNQSLSVIEPASRQDQLAVTQQLATQQNRQGSLQGLLASLQQAMADPKLPADTRQSVERLLSSLPTPSQLTDPKQLSQAISNSGAFLEASLLTGQNPAAGGDLKGQLLQLLAQLQPNLPAGTAQARLAADNLAAVLPAFVRNALGTLGQVGGKSTPASFPLPAGLLGKLGEDMDLQQLLRLASAAIARLQSHQLASLEQTGTTETGKLLTSWQLEIPMRVAQEFVPLQLRLQREEDPAEEDGRPTPERQRQALWRVELAFDLEPLGPLQVQAQWLDSRISSRFFAERRRTAELITGQLEDLRQHLVERGLEVADLDCYEGQPPEGPRTVLQQRWVDETA